MLTLPSPALSSRPHEALATPLKSKMRFRDPCHWLGPDLLQLTSAVRDRSGVHAETLSLLSPRIPRGQERGPAEPMTFGFRESGMIGLFLVVAVQCSAVRNARGFPRVAS